MKHLLCLSLLALPLLYQGHASEKDAAPAPSKVKTLLMFQEGQAEEAMTFYVSLIEGSKVLDIERFGPGEPSAEGLVKLATFTLAGREYGCFDSQGHPFTFTPSMSLFVTCDSEAEFERLSAELSEKGQVLMPPADYGFSRRFTWVEDRFGVSWQVNLPQNDQTSPPR